MDIKFAISDVCTAFDPMTVGSKVLPESKDVFLKALKTAVQEYDGSGDKVPGQHFIVMTDRTILNGRYHVRDMVSAGDGPKSADPADYVVRFHREGPKMFLKREQAGEVKFLGVVVYTREAYFADPDITEDEIRVLNNQNHKDDTHVIVAVIASSGPSAPVTPFRFVHNLAGGNKEYFPPQVPEEISAGDNSYQDYHVWQSYCEDLEAYITGIIGKAQEVRDYWNNYSVVAD